MVVVVVVGRGVRCVWGTLKAGGVGGLEEEGRDVVADAAGRRRAAEELPRRGGRGHARGT